VSPNFADGYITALIDDAIVESAERDAWVDVPALQPARVAEPAVGA
jgi:hypothetical protein